MKDTAKLHRILAGQLRRLELDRELSPSPTAWRELLDILSTAYDAADDERDALKRSIDVSSGEMRDLREVLSEQVMLDTLTGLPNRAALIRHLDQSLSTSARVGRGLAIMYV
ncbi:MAG TPA: GGDEF domain-containing protein, partial [Dermatophilaceae bacterium]